MLLLRAFSVERDKRQNHSKERSSRWWTPWATRDRSQHHNTGLSSSGRARGGVILSYLDRSRTFTRGFRHRRSSHLDWWGSSDCLGRVCRLRVDLCCAVGACCPTILSRCPAPGTMWLLKSYWLTSALLWWYAMDRIEIWKLQFCLDCPNNFAVKFESAR